MSPLVTCLIVAACAFVVCVFGRILLEVIWRLLMAVALAILASLMLAYSLFDAGEGGVAMGALGGFILLPFILKAVWSLRGPIVSLRPVYARCDDQPAAASCPPETLEKDSWPEQGSDLDDAWAQAVILTGEAHLCDAQAACSRLLASAELSPTIDAGLIDAASFVRRQVPALVRETNAVCKVSDDGTCTKARHELRTRLLEIGEMARMALQHRNSKARESLSLRHTHIANRLGSFD